MATALLRRQLLQSSSHARTFSSSPIVAAGAVKRLGVIGAGQMVSTLQGQLALSITDFHDRA